MKYDVFRSETSLTISVIFGHDSLQAQRFKLLDGDRVFLGIGLKLGVHLLQVHT